MVLLYDGVCGFCNATVRFILARDRAGSMRFAPLRGEFAREILGRHSELSGVDSLVLAERPAGSQGERVTVRSDAILAIADYLGWPWRAACILRLCPRVLRDWGYDLVARFRYRLFGRYQVCPVPSPEVRARFLP
ncbi:MAG: DUF393 domain-containing protein [Gemmatimonadetes bacterium]|nr:DUF393 domain-containing protein [Gemmatimonadota bacterium]